MNFTLHKHRFLVKYILKNYQNKSCLKINLVIIFSCRIKVATIRYN